MAIKHKNIAVVGAGYWGKNLVRNFYELGILKTVCDKNKKNLIKIKKNYSEVNITPKLSDLLKDRQIQALVIATPAVTHYHLVKQVLTAGKDVFVEKPLSLDIKEAKELVKLAKDKKLVLMVGHLLFYHPAFIKLKQLITRGQLGKIIYIHSNRLNFGKLRKEENVLWSFAPHDTSLIIDLMERLPKRVGSHGISRLNKGVVDTTLSYLE
jgi:UDP-2-acetamido-3-amino-2,3-dideoxy-glucuronate N-acetyltransferase